MSDKDCVMGHFISLKDLINFLFSEVGFIVSVYCLRPPKNQSDVVNKKVYHLSHYVIPVGVSLYKLRKVIYFYQHIFWFQCSPLNNWS